MERVHELSGTPVREAQFGRNYRPRCISLWREVAVACANVGLDWSSGGAKRVRSRDGEVDTSTNSWSARRHFGTLKRR